MLKCDKKGFLISGETPGQDTMTASGEKSGGGIVPGHAYSILKIKETKSGLRLLNIRNPWGAFEWDGAYSDLSEEWTPELLEEIKPKIDPEDGAFWMCYDDFTRVFESINIC